MLLTALFELRFLKISNSFPPVFIQQYLSTKRQTCVESHGRDWVALVFLVFSGGGPDFKFLSPGTNHLDRVSLSFFPHKYWCTKTQYVTVASIPIPSNSLFTHHPVPQCLNILSLLHCAHIVCMCFVWVWEQTATCATYSINWMSFITEMECVYSAVRTGYLNISQVVLSLHIIKRHSLLQRR
jgi:hypothetical protein